MHFVSLITFPSVDFTFRFERHKNVLITGPSGMTSVDKIIIDVLMLNYSLVRLWEDFLASCAEATLACIKRCSRLLWLKRFQLNR